MKGTPCLWCRFCPRIKEAPAKYGWESNQPKKTMKKTTARRGKIVVAKAAKNQPKTYAEALKLIADMQFETDKARALVQYEATEKQALARYEATKAKARKEYETLYGKLPNPEGEKLKLNITELKVLFKKKAKNGVLSTRAVGLDPEHTKAVILNQRPQEFVYDGRNWPQVTLAKAA